MLLHNLILAAGVSTLLFNLNALMRFDGYFILSDLVEIPNLYGEASAELSRLSQRLFFAQKAAPCRYDGWRKSAAPLSQHFFRQPSYIRFKRGGRSTFFQPSYFCLFCPGGQAFYNIFRCRLRPWDRLLIELSVQFVLKDRKQYTYAMVLIAHRVKRATFSIKTENGIPMP